MQYVYDDMIKIQSYGLVKHFCLYRALRCWFKLNLGLHLVSIVKKETLTFSLTM